MLQLKKRLGIDLKNPFPIEKSRFFCRFHTKKETPLLISTGVSFNDKIMLQNQLLINRQFLAQLRFFALLLSSEKIPQSVPATV